MAKFNFRGTGVAIVTPFKKSGAVDYDGLKNLVNHLIKGKVEYLVILGTTGETATLSKDEKQLVLDCVVKENKKRLPLVVGVGGNDTAEVVKAIKKVDANSFAAILSVSPYYNKPSQEGIYQHYKAISKASKLPIILYNVPGRTASNLTWETTVRLAKDFKNIVAVKEASANLEQMMKIMKHKPKGFVLISGDDNLTLPILGIGGEGVISVVANAYPQNFSDMVRAGLKQDFEKARKLHYRLIDITDQLFADGNPGGIKQALHRLKVCGPTVRLPLVEPNEKVIDKLYELMKKY